MSAIDNTEVSRSGEGKSEDTLLSVAMKSNSSKNPSQEAFTLRRPKRLLHFSDGTLEEFDDTDSEQENETVGDSPITRSSAAPENLTTPVNPKTLPWSSWIHYYTTTTGQKTLNVLDNIGENIAYYLGITTPKYQYEIDEYNRAKQHALAKQKEKEIELNSWATTSPRLGRMNEPIVTEVTEVIQQPERR